MRRLVALARRLRFVTVTPDTEMAYELTHGRKHVRLEPRERISMLTTGIGFVVAATALLTLAPPGHVKPGLAVMLVVALAVMSRVELVLASGFAVPTQLVVVPILFLVPAAAAPPLIAVALVLGRAVDVVLGRRHPERLFVGLCDAWFSLGPAVVLVAAGVNGVHGDDWPWCCWRSAPSRRRHADVVDRGLDGRRPLAALHVRELAVVWLVDAALAPVGLLAAAVAVVSPAAILGVFPLAAMIAALAQERSYRIEQEVELSSAYQGVALLLGEVIEDDDHSPASTAAASSSCPSRSRAGSACATASSAWSSSARSCTASATSRSRTRSSTRPATRRAECAIITATRSTARRCSPASAA